MEKLSKFLLLGFVAIFMSSCIVSKKEYNALNTRYETSKRQLEKARADLNGCNNELSSCKSSLSAANATSTATSSACEEKVALLQNQIDFLKTRTEKDSKQAEDLVAMSTKATENMNKTLENLAKKEEYIYLLQAAKTKADSINLALSANLKVALKDGIEDKDVDVKVDKTVVFINLSDKMLFNSGSYKITNRADEVLAKIATIVQGKEDIEVMVEGYTDSDPINKACVKDNWELSVLRSTAVVKSLQNKHGVDPNRLIAAGRGQYNALAPNDTDEGKATNRRTRIIILPKIDQFYDLLKPVEEE